MGYKTNLNGPRVSCKTLGPLRLVLYPTKTPAPTEPWFLRNPGPAEVGFLCGVKQTSMEPGFVSGNLGPIEVGPMPYKQPNLDGPTVFVPEPHLSIGNLGSVEVGLIPHKNPNLNGPRVSEKPWAR